MASVKVIRACGRETEHRGRAARFRTLDTDLIALQETVVTDEIDHVRPIVGDGRHVARSQHRAPDGTGVSIVSRWPFDDVEELELEGSARTAASRVRPDRDGRSACRRGTGALRQPLPEREAAAGAGA